MSLLNLKVSKLQYTVIFTAHVWTCQSRRFAGGAHYNNGNANDSFDVGTEQAVSLRQVIKRGKYVLKRQRTQTAEDSN